MSFARVDLDRFKKEEESLHAYCMVCKKGVGATNIALWRHISWFKRKHKKCKEGGD